MDPWLWSQEAFKSSWNHMVWNRQNLKHLQKEPTHFIVVVSYFWRCRAIWRINKTEFMLQNYLVMHCTGNLNIFFCKLWIYSLSFLEVSTQFGRFPSPSEAVSKLNFSVSRWSIFQFWNISSITSSSVTLPETNNKDPSKLMVGRLLLSFWVLDLSKAANCCFWGGYWSTSLEVWWFSFSWGGHCLSVVRAHVERSASKAKWPVFRVALMLWCAVHDQKMRRKIWQQYILHKSYWSRVDWIL